MFWPWKSRPAHCKHFNKMERWQTMKPRSIREWLLWGKAALLPGESAALESRVLLSWASGRPQERLFAHPEARLSKDTKGRFQAAIRRRQAHEPLAYIVGERWFYGLRFRVNPAVLVPRPESEELVEYAVARLRRAEPAGTPLRVADVGCGSGAIGVALAHTLPAVRIIAIDVSAPSLAVACLNARLNHVSQQMQFIQSDLLAAVMGPFHFIAANLPYVSQKEYEALPSDIHDYEPRLALWGGKDGLLFIKKLLRQARTRLLPGGTLMAEIGWQQGEAAQRLAQEQFPGQSIQIRHDLAGQTRFLVVSGKAENKQATPHLTR